jgi:hypothetical protein
VASTSEFPPAVVPAGSAPTASPPPDPSPSDAALQSQPVRKFKSVKDWMAAKKADQMAKDRIRREEEALSEELPHK